MRSRKFSAIVKSSGMFHIFSVEQASIKLKYEDGEVEWFRHHPDLVFSILGIPDETEEGLAKIDALIDGETIEDVDKDGRKFKMRIIREIPFCDTYGPLEKVLTPEDYE